MQNRSSIIILNSIKRVSLYSLIFFISFTQSTFFLYAQNKNEVDIKKKFHGRYSDDLLIPSEDSKSEKSVKDLKTLIEGLDSLIKVEKNEEKKLNLYFSKGSAHLNIAKNYRLSIKQNPSFIDKEQDNLRKVIKIAEFIEKNKKAGPLLLSRTYHMHGLAFLFLKDELKTVDLFAKAIEIHRDAPVNPRLSVYIAEYLFDKEKYSEALPRYSDFFDKLSQEEKAMVIYKSAWCFVLTKQYANAEKAFLKVIGKNWAGDFAVDSLKDLSFTVASHMSEQEVLDFGRENFTGKILNLLVDFYTETYMVYIKQSGNIDRTLLFNEVIKLEKRPERKVALSVKKYSSHQKEYASVVPMEDLKAIEKLLIDYKIKPNSEEFKYFASELENEVLRTTKAYAETIAKKVKTPEKLDDMIMSQTLDRVLKFHIDWFPESPKIANSYRVSLDNCLFSKNIACSIRVSREILKKDFLKEIWERARYDLITSLDKETQSNPKAKDDLYNELVMFSKEQEASKHWLIFSKRLTGLQVDNKKYDEAEPILLKIYQKEITVENLYRYLFCMYKQNKYKEVIAYLPKSPKEGQYFDEIQILMRESSLQLALESAKADDFDKYESYLAQFMSLKPEPSKADLARVDYYQKLIDKNQSPKVLGLLSTAPHQIRFGPTFTKISSQILIYHLKEGKFKEAYTYLSKDSKFGLYPEFNSLWVRSTIGSGIQLTVADYKIVSQFKGEEKSSVLGLLAVSYPEEVVKYFEAFPPNDDREKKIYLLCLQWREGQREVNFTSKQFEELKSVIPADLLNTQTTSSEKLSGYLEFPDIKWSEKRLEKVMPDAVSRIRAIRPQVLRDVKNKGIPVQKRILTRALNNEIRMVEFFKNAPVPKGLSDDNVAAYKKELEEIAKEFEQQADEFKKMIENLDQKLIDSKKEEMFPPEKMSSWPLPSNDISTLVQTLVTQNNHFGALVVLETQRAIDKITLQDYHKLRSFVILSKHKNSISSKYVFDELSLSKQDDLILSWKTLIGKNTEMPKQ